MTGAEQTAIGLGRVLVKRKRTTDAQRGFAMTGSLALGMGRETPAPVFFP
ncbi:hypothetical protein APED_08315 [Acanthopleuribacter pedis]